MRRPSSASAPARPLAAFPSPTPTRPSAWPVIGHRWRQAHHQRLRLPADPGSDHRHLAAVRGDREEFRIWMRIGVPRPSSATPSTTAAIGGRSTTRASSPSPSTMRERATAGACTNSAARDRPPTTPAPRIKWNGGTSFPIQSGHGCLGCSEPDFWDKGSFLLRAVQPPRGARRAKSHRARSLKSPAAPPPWAPRWEWHPPASAACVNTTANTDTTVNRRGVTHGSIGLRARAGT